MAESFLANQPPLADPMPALLSGLLSYPAGLSLSDLTNLQSSCSQLSVDPGILGKCHHKDNE